MIETEEFWGGPFGDEYVRRNDSPAQIQANVAFFREALSPIHHQLVQRIIEFGPNTGPNIAALKEIAPYAHAEYAGVEINALAADTLERRFPDVKLWRHSMTGPRLWGENYDLAISKGVLIHIHPDNLPIAYDALYRASRRYIFIAEYHNSTPVEVKYRGHDQRLWKRDFAAEMLGMFPELRVKKYGFAWRHDQRASQDDLVYTLLAKE